MQESRENAERKQEEGEWAKPRPNKNPLEKTGAAHGIGQGGESTGRLMHPAARMSQRQLHLAAGTCACCCRGTLAIYAALARCC
jgi:hypothetical protein